MYKLVIIIGPLDSWAAFDEAWPRFLRQVENMPGLRRESTSRVDTVIYGTAQVSFIHELFFDSLEAASQAMTSPAGNAAGRLLQAMTRGQVTLFLADHKEDDLENIRRYKQSSEADQASSQENPAG
ncbi:MAG: EthD family reductase [Anaerolineales bacterium]